MALKSSTSAQGIVIREGTVDNYFTAIPDNNVYPTVEGYFEPDGFPGGFDTLLATAIIQADGGTTVTYTPSIFLDNLYEFLIDEYQPFVDAYSNFPPLSGVTELDVLPGAINTFVTTNAVNAVGGDVSTYAPSAVLGELFEYLVEGQDDILDNNSNYLETYAPPISGS